MSDKWLVLTFLIIFFSTSIIIGTGCVDGYASSSIGSRGACSHHGGVSHMNVLGGMFLGALGTVIIGSIFKKKDIHPIQPPIQLNLIKQKPKRRRTAQSTKKTRTVHKHSKYVDSYPKRTTSNIGIEKERISPKKPNEIAPLCPNCGKSMLFKDAKNYGFNFWGCVDYPICRGISKYNPSTNSHHI
ncbi:hypothetical protein [Acinetobacter indicus]|uniref:hypothetical protein n=1 Tax=Acinetobacter indicus TaxID=756892 RepID=UPI0014443073|nr:hypothetical protein [Acinetobacter indicus]MDM1491856.1 hypothetical protein [Acinetobacter indicus]